MQTVKNDNKPALVAEAVEILTALQTEGIKGFDVKECVYNLLYRNGKHWEDSIGEMESVIRATLVVMNDPAFTKRFAELYPQIHSDAPFYLDKTAEFFKDLGTESAMEEIQLMEIEEYTSQLSVEDLEYIISRYKNKLAVERYRNSLRA